MVDTRWLLPLPTSASFAEGAAFPMAFLTAWIPLTELVASTIGARVLVTAAAGAGGHGGRADHQGCSTATRSRQSEARRSWSFRAHFRGAVESVTYEELGQARPGRRRLRPRRWRGSSPRGLGLLKPMGTAIAVGYAGGLWQDVSPAWLVGRNIGVHGFYLGRLIGQNPRPGEACRRATSCACGRWARCGPSSEPSLPSRNAAEAHRLIEISPIDGKGRPHSMTALVTGSAGGIGSAIVREAHGRGLRSEGARPRERFRRQRPDGLGARRLGGSRSASTPECSPADRDIAALTDEQYRRAVGVNVDGVVYGVRRLDRVMPKGSTIIVDRLARGPCRDPRRPDLRADETRRRRLGPLSGAAAHAARNPHPGRVPRLGRHRAHAAQVQAGSRGPRLPAALARGGRRRRVGRVSE